MARKRREYSAAERRELWQRWKRGESYAEIARALDRVPATIYCTISRQGGIAPPERRRSRLALTLCEREEISRGIASGRSARRIAACLGRSPSTITREIYRHGGRSSYRAAEADQRAWQHARRPQLCKLAGERALSQLVAAKLAEDLRRKHSIRRPKAAKRENRGHCVARRGYGRAMKRTDTARPSVIYDPDAVAELLAMKSKEEHRTRCSTQYGSWATSASSSDRRT